MLKVWYKKKTFEEAKLWRKENQKKGKNYEEHIYTEKYHKVPIYIKKYLILTPIPVPNPAPNPNPSTNPNPNLNTNPNPY